MRRPERAGLLVCQVRDDDVDAIRRLTEIAVNELLGETIVEEIYSSLIVASIGSIFPMPDPATALRDQVERLRDKLGNDIRLVYGMVLAETGNIGGPNRLAFGTIVPGFGRWIAALTVLDFGEAAELPDASAAQS